jgi:hypothetical protein
LLLAFAFYWTGIALVLHYLLSKIITRKEAWILAGSAYSDIGFSKFGVDPSKSLELRH